MTISFTRFTCHLVAAAMAAFMGMTVMAQTSTPTQIRIGFQKSAVNLVILKQRAVLEQRFKESKISWVEFPAGPQLLEALAVGSLEIGLTGDSPPVFAQAAGKNLRYVGVEPPKPESSAVLVPAHSPITKLSELKGKRIALQKGSSAHYLLVRTVQRAGLNWNDIQPIYLAPAEARAAFEKGAVDAWAIWDPYYSAAELDLKPRVLTTGRELSGNNSFYLASRHFTDNYPDAVLAILSELSNADQYVQHHRKEVAELIANTSGLNLATVHLFISRRPVPSSTTLLPPSVIRDQQQIADAFVELGLIPRKITVAELVWQPRLPKTAPAQEK